MFDISIEDTFIKWSVNFEEDAFHPSLDEHVTNVTSPPVDWYANDTLDYNFDIYGTFLVKIIKPLLNCRKNGLHLTYALVKWINLNFHISKMT